MKIGILKHSLQMIDSTNVITIDEQSLPHGLCGYYIDSERRIILHDKLSARQRRCVLTHELIHAKHRDVPCDGVYGAREECRARKETALALISPVDYEHAEQTYEGNAYSMAVALNVTMQVLEDYQRTLAI